MVAAFEVGGHSVPPGQKVRIELPLARLVTQQEIGLPLVVLHGREAGPAMWLSAAIHGDEVHGTEVIRRVLADVSPDTLRGTLLAMPVVNVWGFVQQSRYLPDRRDLNRSFPGSRRGSLAGQIAHLLMTEVVSRCDLGVDLHAGSDHRTNVPQIRGDVEDERVRALGGAFAAPFMLHASLRSGSLRHAAAKLGIPCLLYEAGEPHRFDETAVSCGHEGVLRVMQREGMIDAAPAAGGKTRIAMSSHWMRASRSGILHLEVSLGSEVSPRDTVGLIRDPFGDVAARVQARRGGAVIGHTLNPLVNRGDAILHLAHVV